MLNRIIIMGRLTRDPELRRTNSGLPVAHFSIACDRDFTEGTDFVDCIAWRNTGEFVSKYFSKGRAIVVDGRLQIREWKDNEGRRRMTPEIVADSVYFGDSKRDEPKEQTSYLPQELDLTEEDEEDGSLPF